MALASVAELERASAQGTIVSIKVDDVMYGKGGLHKHMEFTEQYIIIMAVSLFLIVFGFLFVARKMISRRIRRSFREWMHPTSELKQSLDPAEHETVSGVSDKLSSSSDDDEDDCDESVQYHNVVDDFVDDMSTDSAKEKASAVLEAADARISRQRDRIDSLRIALDMEKVGRDLERDRLRSQLASLEAQLAGKQD